MSDLKIDKGRTVNMLDREAKGWGDTFCWDIVRLSIDRYSWHEDTLEELTDIRDTLNKCIRQMEKHKEEITLPKED